MMVPVPEGGVLRGVEGQAEAAAAPGVVEVAITARPGEVVRALPEGSAYLGFIFAKGETPERVTSSLRRAAAALTPRITPQL